MSELVQLKRIIEGALLAADHPLTLEHIAQLFFEQDRPSNADIRKALAEIEESCAGRGFELKEVASGWRFQVSQDLGSWVARLWEEKPARYSRALLETLALIAYRQPVTRGEVEEIRGVSVSSNIIRTLLEREWVRVVGHRDVPGKPAMYATTKAFLDYFSLKSLDELPTLAEIRDLDKLNVELEFDNDNRQHSAPQAQGEPSEGMGSAQEENADYTGHALVEDVDAEQEASAQPHLSADESSAADSFDNSDEERDGRSTQEGTEAAGEEGLRG